MIDTFKPHALLVEHAPIEIPADALKNLQEANLKEKITTQDVDKFFSFAPPPDLREQMRSSSLQEESAFIDPVKKSILTHLAGEDLKVFMEGSKATRLDKRTGVIF